MIIPAGVAAQAASALAQSLQGKPSASAGGSAATDFQNLTADIDALLPGGTKAGTTGAGSGTGSIGGDLSALGQDLLGQLGLGVQGTAAAAPAAPGAATQAYATASTLAT